MILGIPEADFWAFFGSIIGSILITILLLWRVKGDSEWLESKK